MAPRLSPRARLHDALLDLCFERGFTRVDLTALLTRAGVDRPTFEREFAGLEDCFFEVFREEIESYRRPLPSLPAGWRERVRDRAYSLYRFLAEDQRRSRLIVVDVRAAGERTLLFAGQLIEELFDLIDEGRQELADPSLLTRTTAESIGGGAFNQLYAILGRDAVLPPEVEIVPQLMYCAVLPYLGPTAALQELEIPPPPSRPSHARSAFPADSL
jgi:AcrR family transcriptional regulator